VFLGVFPRPVGDIDQTHCLAVRGAVSGAGGGALVMLLQAALPALQIPGGSDILGSALKDVGITLKVEPMPFATWLAKVFLPTGPQDYDLTMINHAEERDIGNYGNPKYYWHYDNAQVQQLLVQADGEVDDAKRMGLYGKILKQLADDAAGAWVWLAEGSLRRQEAG